jgi:nanoRNase/pAp phosphatase (c-di-AMP/oligoRNAs hydrolase)
MQVCGCNHLFCSACELYHVGHFVNAGTYCHSELLGELAKGADFAVGWFATARGTYRYSLRSDPQGLDVSAIAKLFGGGGHKHAAGFEVDQPVHTYV